MGCAWESGRLSVGLVQCGCCQVGRLAGVGWLVVAAGARQGVLNVL